LSIEGGMVAMIGEEEMREWGFGEFGDSH